MVNLPFPVNLAVFQNMGDLKNDQDLVPGAWVEFELLVLKDTGQKQVSVSFFQ